MQRYSNCGICALTSYTTLSSNSLLVLSMQHPSSIPNVPHATFVPLLQTYACLSTLGTTILITDRQDIARHYLKCEFDSNPPCLHHPMLTTIQSLQQLCKSGLSDYNRNSLLFALGMGRSIKKLVPCCCDVVDCVGCTDSGSGSTSCERNALFSRKPVLWLLPSPGAVFSAAFAGQIVCIGFGPTYAAPTTGYLHLLCQAEGHRLTGPMS